MAQEPKSTRKVLQIGVGAWGHSWLPILADHPRFEAVAIVSRSQSKLHDVAATAGIDQDRCFTSLGAALTNGPQADVALIVVPPAAHSDVAVEALDAGLDCLIEKPLASTMDEGRRILAARERSGKTVMVSQNYRFRRAARTVRQLIQEDAVGKVEHVQVDFHKNPVFTGFRMEMNEPLIADMSIHHLDHLRGTAGFEPNRLRARSWNPSWSEYAGNAFCLIEFESADGARASYTGSWASRGLHTSWDGTWEIQGERGALRWCQNRVEIRYASLFDTVFMEQALERHGVMEVDLLPISREDRLAVLDEFAASLDASRTPETDVADNIKSLALMLAALESTEHDGREIELAAFGAG